MRKLLSLLGFALALMAALLVPVRSVTTVSLPYLVDTAAVPKVKYVDKNDSALKWGVNQLADSLNAATGTGSLVRATGATLGAHTATGLLTTAGGLQVTGGSGADGALWKSAGAGLAIRGVAGSSYDLALFTPLAAYLLRNPTGTQNLEVLGSLSGTSSTWSSTITSGNHFFGTAGTGVFFDSPGTFLDGVFKDASSNLNLRAGSNTARSTIFGTTGNMALGGTTDNGYRLDVNGTGRFTSELLSTSGAVNPTTSGTYMTGEGVDLNRSGGGGMIRWYDGSGVQKWAFQRYNVNGNMVLYPAVGATGGDGIFNIATSISGTSYFRVDVPNGAVSFPALSSGRVPVLTSGGVIGTDNLYWDATNDRLGVGSGASAPASEIDVTKAAIGSDVLAQVVNTDNTNGSSNARLLLSTGGASGGDPFIRYNVSGASNWVHGIDNSDGDKWKLSASTALGTSDVITATTAGAVAIPGTLGAVGDFSVNTNKFNVTASTGSFIAAGGGTVNSSFNVFNNTFGAGTASEIIFQLADKNCYKLQYISQDGSNNTATFRVNMRNSSTGNADKRADITEAGNLILYTNSTTPAPNVSLHPSGFSYLQGGNLAVGGSTDNGFRLEVTGTAKVSGNTTVGGTLGVTGAAIASGTLGVTGDFSVNTNKFNVTASSGNTSVAGTLGVTGATTLASSLSGPLKAASGVVSASSINLTSEVTGTLPVANGGTGTTSSTGTGSVMLSASPTTTGTLTAAAISASGNATVGGTLGATGAATFSGGIASVASSSGGFYEEGSFTGTMVGITTTVTHTITYVRVGKHVTMTIPAFSGTSNSPLGGVSGVPASLRPTSFKFIPLPFTTTDNGSALGNVSITVSSVGSGLDRIDWYTTIPGVSNNATPFTASGAKATPANAFTFTYSLD